ncbi:MAG: PilZ domain-containing protein [bacterium]|nr:PilZ domain-containing protein [bacterium]
MGEIKDRKFKRIESLNLVTFTHYDSEMNPDYEGAARTLDISENGILLEFFRDFPDGTFMDMEVALHDTIIKVKGRIVRCTKQETGEKFNLGIQFTEISNENRELIKNFFSSE